MRVAADSPVLRGSVAIGTLGRLLLYFLTPSKFTFRA